jgi:hypothetical protein
MWVGALVGTGAVTAADADTVRVFVFDYAQVSPATLDGAKTVASDIFKRVGLEVEWADCDVRVSEAPPAPPCRHLTPFDVQIRILNASMAKNLHNNELCLGYALPAGPFGVVAAIYYERDVNIERAGLALYAMFCWVQRWRTRSDFYYWPDPAIRLPGSCVPRSTSRT